MERIEKFMIRLILLGIVGGVGLSSHAFAKDEKIVEGNRTNKGYKIAKGSYVDIPDDVRLKQVAHNVIKQESAEEYLTRRFEEMESRLDEMETNVNDRLDQIENRLEQVEKS